MAQLLFTTKMITQLLLFLFPFNEEPVIHRSDHASSVVAVHIGGYVSSFLVCQETTSNDSPVVHLRLFASKRQDCFLQRDGLEVSLSVPTRECFLSLMSYEQIRRSLQLAHSSIYSIAEVVAFSVDQS